MYNHNKAQQSKNRVHISRDMLYFSMLELKLIHISKTLGIEQWLLPWCNHSNHLGKRSHLITRVYAATMYVPFKYNVMVNDNTKLNLVGNNGTQEAQNGVQHINIRFAPFWS